MPPPIHPLARDFIAGLARLGARAAAAAVDVALEEGQALASEVQTRLKRGRDKASEINTATKPKTSRIKVEAQKTDDEGDTNRVDVIDAEEI